MPPTNASQSDSAREGTHAARPGGCVPQLEVAAPVRRIIHEHFQASDGRYQGKVLDFPYATGPDLPHADASALTDSAALLRIRSALWLDGDDRFSSFQTYGRSQTAPKLGGIEISVAAVTERRVLFPSFLGTELKTLRLDAARRV